MKHAKKASPSPCMKAALAALGASLGVSMMPVASAADTPAKPANASKATAKQAPGQANSLKLKAGGVDQLKFKSTVAPGGASQYKERAPAGSSQYKEKIPAGSKQLKITPNAKNAPAGK